MYRLSMAALIAFPLAASLVPPAEAQQANNGVARYEHAGSCTLTNDGRSICSGVRTARARKSRAGRRRVYASNDGKIIGGRPAGCPHAYCGCGLRKYLGIADKRLNLARNWARLFPRVANPQPGVAAVRSGHVMYIERSAGNGRWLVRDYNSGGGLSRLHVRSVRGYLFVNPHVQRLLVAQK